MFTSIFLQASTQESIMNMLPFVAMIGVFYFLIIRPQMKRQKNEKKFQSTVHNQLLYHLKMLRDNQPHIEQTLLLQF